MVVKAFRLLIELLEPFDGTYLLKISTGCDGSPMHVAELELSGAELEKRYQAALGILVEDRNAQEQAIDLFLPK
jgi:hypothetical protein